MMLERERLSVNQSQVWAKLTLLLKRVMAQVFTQILLMIILEPLTEKIHNPFISNKL